MIHIKRASEACKVGLNLYRAAGGFVVHREVLADLQTAEDVEKRVNESLAYIKPV